MIVRCGFISLYITLGLPYSKIDELLSKIVPGAVSAFQATFPDKHGFRSRVIAEAVHFGSRHHDQVNILPKDHEVTVVS